MNKKRVDWERLRNDPSFTYAAFERLLGSPKDAQPNGRGWYHFQCPAAGCVAEGYKLGVCFSSSYNGSFKCFRCELSGVGFENLCKRLGVDVADYVDESVEVKTLQSVPKQQTEDPLDPRLYSRIWRWVALQSRREDQYGEEFGGLSRQHAELLERRGLEIGRLPYWFSIPDRTTIDRAVQRWGTILADRAGIWSIEKNSPRLFCQQGRIAIVCPESDWLQRTVPFGFIRSYLPGAGPNDIKLLGPTGYGTGRQLYSRVEMTDLDNNPSRTWVVTEGEIKAEASYQAGFETVGLLGCNIGHTELIRLVLLALERNDAKAPQCIVLCFDTEETESKQQRLDRVTEGLRQNLEKAVQDKFQFRMPIGYCRLPSEDEQKADIDSFIGHHQRTSGLREARRIFRKEIVEAAEKANRVVGR